MTCLHEFPLAAGAVLVLGLLFEHGAYAGPVSQGANFHHTQWTSENGVGSVFDIQQSPDGYLWLTTSRGVLRFDGVQFQTVADATYGGVDTNEIDSVYLPSSGGLWLTTMSAGLLYWKDGRLTAFPDRRCTPTRKMGRLAEDRDGSLWVQGAAGLFHLRGSVCEQAGVEIQRDRPRLLRRNLRGFREALPVCCGRVPAAWFAAWCLHNL